MNRLGNVCFALLSAAVVLTLGTSAHAGCFHDDDDDVIIRYLPQGYVVPGPVMESQFIDWAELLRLIGLTINRPNDPTPQDLSELDATLDRIEDKVAKLETLYERRVKKTEEELATLSVRQQELMTQLDKRIQDLEKMTTDNRTMIGETLDVVTTQQETLEQLVVLLSGDYMVKNQTTKQYASDLTETTPALGKELTQGQAVRLIRYVQKKNGPRYAHIRVPKTDISGPFTTYVLDTALVPINKE